MNSCTAMRKERTTIAKVPVHFIGFLANVDHSTTGLKIGNRFTVDHKSNEDGEAVYKEMKGLYDRRSKLVHTGDKSVVAREDVLRLRHYVRETIKEAIRSQMSKEALLNRLNACGFGERPWRGTT